MRYLLILSVLVFLGCSSNKMWNDNGKLKYVFKYEQDCENIDANQKNRKNVYRIFIKYPIVSDSIPFYEMAHTPCSYQWNKAFSYYPKEDQYKILEELLFFKNDTDTSGIKINSYGSYKCNILAHTESYTLQIEALYLFTTLVMGFSSQEYNPYPIIMDRETGDTINDNQLKIKDVFDIYRGWFNQYSKCDFRDVPPPLKDTKYTWLRCNPKYETEIENRNIKVLNLWGRHENIGRNRDGQVWEPDMKYKKFEDPSEKIWKREMKRKNGKIPVTEFGTKKRK